MGFPHAKCFQHRINHCLESDFWCLFNVFFYVYTVRSVKMWAAISGQDISCKASIILLACFALQRKNTHKPPEALIRAPMTLRMWISQHKMSFTSFTATFLPFPAPIYRHAHLCTHSPIISFSLLRLPPPHTHIHWHKVFMTPCCRGQHQSFYSLLCLDKRPYQLSLSSAFMRLWWLNKNAERGNWPWTLTFCDIHPTSTQ